MRIDHAVMQLSEAIQLHTGNPPLRIVVDARTMDIIRSTAPDDLKAEHVYSPVDKETYLKIAGVRIDVGR